MEIKNKLAVTRGEGREGKWGTEGKGSSQGTCIKDPWKWTTGWGLTEGAGDWVCWRKATGEKFEQL